MTTNKPETNVLGSSDAYWRHAYWWFSQFCLLEDLTTYLNPETWATAIQEAVRGSYRLGKVMVDSVDTVLSVYATEVKTFMKMITDR